MKILFNQRNFSSQRGMAPIVLLLFLFLLLGLFIGANYAYIYYLTQCGDSSISTCFNESKKKTEEQSSETIEEKISVIATGSYAYKNAFDTKEFLAMTIYPMRLCFDCAELQHYIRQIRKYPDTEE